MNPVDVATEIVAILKANADLVAALPESEDGIREAHWRGTRFEYPNVRVGRVMLTPYGNGNCAPVARRVQFTIYTGSKLDSSVTAQALQGLVEAALDGVHVDTMDLVTIVPLRLQMLSPVGPELGAQGTQTQIWSGALTFRGVLKERA